MNQFFLFIFIWILAPVLSVSFFLCSLPTLFLSRCRASSCLPEFGVLRPFLGSSILFPVLEGVLYFSKHILAFILISVASSITPLLQLLFTVGTKMNLLHFVRLLLQSLGSLIDTGTKMNLRLCFFVNFNDLRFIYTVILFRIQPFEKCFC